MSAPLGRPAGRSDWSGFLADGPAVISTALRDARGVPGPCDTAEGYPGHDLNLPRFFCHECSGQMRPCQSDGDEYTCLACGETILCDECGQPWTDGHACLGDEQEAPRLDR